MPILPLTARTVATLRAPSDKPRIEYFDAEVSGLTLRITSDGVKTWSLVYRHHARKRRLTLGRFPDIGLAKARLRATEERGRIAGGSDPASEKHDGRPTFGDTVGACSMRTKRRPTRNAAGQSSGEQAASLSWKPNRCASSLGVAVDFAYKQRQRGGEGWALRSTKLRLSRKLIFASGLLMCFSCALDPAVASLTAGSPSRVQTIIEHLWKLSRRPPIDLLAETFLLHDALNGVAVDMFGAYDDFLGLLNDAEARSRLATLSYADAATDETYELIRRLGHRFQGGLTRLFFEEDATGIPELTRIYGVF